MTGSVRDTPLHDRHVASGATMVEFAGYSMPQQYTSIRDEHVAVRERAGLFDLSHMGEIRFRGNTAATSVQRLVANDIGRLGDGQALYAVMCNERGGIVDDVVVYRDAADDYMVVVNAACREKDVAWMQRHVQSGTVLTDDSDGTALLALQGPHAVEVMASIAEDDLSAMPPFSARITQVAGRPARVSRTGYTGEDGFEIYVAADTAPPVWDALVEGGRGVGILPVGLGARDTLRLEAGLRLYGQDMDEDVDPFSCGLGWTVKLDKGNFTGASALSAASHAHPRRFIGLHLEGRAIARHGHTTYVDGRPVGEVTSGTFGFSVGRGIATTYVPRETDAGSTIAVDIRGTRTPAREVRLPFYRRPQLVTSGGA